MASGERAGAAGAERQAAPEGGGRGEPERGPAEGGPAEGAATAPAARRDRSWRARGQGGAALMVVAGAAATSSSGMFIKLSEVNAGTAAFLRCALALVVLVPLACFEYRRIGPRPLRLLGLDLAAGVLIGLDYVFWVESIHDLGASIATLLLNIQLIVFPLLARFLTGARLERRFWLTAPVLLLGIALAGGAIGRAEPGSDPASGVLFGSIAGVAFAGYLFLIRLGGEGGRSGRRASEAGGTGTAPRQPGAPHTVVPVCTATFAAAVAAGVLGSLWTGVDVNPGWPAWGWLIPMAFFGQVLAWLLINPALARLAPDKGATLLLLQPVLALLFGVGFLGERPTLTQYAGCALVVLAVWRATRTDH